MRGEGAKTAIMPVGVHVAMADEIFAGLLTP